MLLPVLAFFLAPVALEVGPAEGLLLGRVAEDGDAQARPRDPERYAAEGCVPSPATSSVPAAGRLFVPGSGPRAPLLLLGDLPPEAPAPIPPPGSGTAADAGDSAPVGLPLPVRVEESLLHAR